MNIHVIKRVLRRLWPFRGNCAWEMQICALVFQWRHDGKPWSPDRYKLTGKGLTIYPLHIWYDRYWRK